MISSPIKSPLTNFHPSLSCFKSIEIFVNHNRYTLNATINHPGRSYESYFITGAFFRWFLWPYHNWTIKLSVYRTKEEADVCVNFLGRRAREHGMAIVFSLFFLLAWRAHSKGVKPCSSLSCNPRPISVKLQSRRTFSSKLSSLRHIVKTCNHLGFLWDTKRLPFTWR